MKKIFTLLCAAALAVPMRSADEVTINLYARNGTMANIKIGDFKGSMKNDVSYDAATGIYSITNFLGYTNGNIDFTLMDDEKFTSGSGEERTPLCYSVPSGSIIIAANDAKTKWTFHTTNEEFGDDTDLTYIDVFDSGVFTGNSAYTEYDYMKLVDTSIWGVCDDSSAAAFENVKKRSYAVPVNGGYQFVIEVQSLAVKTSTGAGYSYINDAFDIDMDDFNFLAVFTLGETSTGVSEITVDNESAVEYFNLQGVRVNNPTNGLYIMRQGSKTTKVSIR